MLALTSYFQFRRSALLPFALCLEPVAPCQLGSSILKRVLLSRKRPLSTVKAPWLVASAQSPELGGLQKSCCTLSSTYTATGKLEAAWFWRNAS